ncbi:hypothetical protein IJI99_00455 [bacterium]|nr:hypothetical protein [bacterium]
MKFVAKYWCVLSLAWLLTARVVLAAKKSVIAQIAVGGKITIGGEEFIKSNNKGLLMMASTLTCPHGKKIAGRWVYCYTCDPDHGYFDYDNETCACESGWRYRQSDRSCFQCPVNSVWDATEQVCKCNANYYMHSNGEWCNACPTNSTSEPGGTSVAACTCGIGHTIDVQNATCVPNGTYSSTLNDYYDNTLCSNPVGWMNTWSGCSSLSELDTVCLVDPRDHRAYKVRKFSDNQCWMINNLRFGGNYGGIDGCAAYNYEGNYTQAWCGGNSVSGCTSGGATSLAKARETFTTGYYGHCRTYSTNPNYNYLYDWVAATQSTLAYRGSSTSFPDGHQGLCPAGWHLPADTDFNVLKNYYNYNSGVIIIDDLECPLGIDCEESGNDSTYVEDFWISPNYWNAYPAGVTTGTSVSQWNTYADYWSSTSSTSTNSTLMVVNYNLSSQSSTGTIAKSSGLAIRCIQD